MDLRGSNHPTRMQSGVVFERQDFTYVPIAKNGSSSILKTLWESSPEFHPSTLRSVMSDAITTSTAVVMLREPTSRAWSAYSMMRRHPSMYGESSDKPQAWYPDNQLSWDEWLHELLKNRFHNHLSATMIPQHEYLCSPVKYEYIAWDFKAMGERLGVELPHINSAGQKWQQRGEPEGHAPPMPDITPEMRYNLQIVYGADYRIWELVDSGKL